MIFTEGGERMNEVLKMHCTLYTCAGYTHAFEDINKMKRGKGTMKHFVLKITVCISYILAACKSDSNLFTHTCILGYVTFIISTLALWIVVAQMMYLYRAYT